MLDARVQTQAPYVTQSPQLWVRSIWLAVVVSCIYILSARMSLALLTPDGVAVFWPAAGVAAGMLIALGPSTRWAVVIGTIAGTMVANLLGDRNLFSSMIFALCNAGEAVLAAALIEWYFGSRFRLDRLRNVLGFLGAAVVAAAVSGIGGTLGFVLFHDAAASILVTWQNWFASDALGIITIAPLIIGLNSAARDPPTQNEIIEGSIALVSLVLLCFIVIALPPEPSTTVVPLALLFPVLLWITARCRPGFAAVAVFIVTLAIVWTTTIEVGHFGNPIIPIADRVLAARAGIIAVALCAYVLAALFAERRQHVAVLAESERRLQQALTAGGVTTFVWDVGTGSSQRSANAAPTLGFDPRQTFTPRDFLLRVHSDDREQFKTAVRSVNPERPAYKMTFRFNHPDRREVWLEETATAEFDNVRRLVRVRGLTIDVTARQQSEEQQRLLIAALDQRAKDLLARVAGVAKDMRKGRESLDEYIRALDWRIQSMADAHALLSRNRWEGADLAELIRRQLAPNGTDANVTLTGPNVTLSVAATQGLAMVLHELVTNAAKYGALSSPHGRLEVSWQCQPACMLISWREIGGPPLKGAPQWGYGISIIRDLIPREFGGLVDLTFGSGGVSCNIEFPFNAGQAVPQGHSEIVDRPVQMPTR
jgi:two-component sensor histidine kinase/integral membrane sensor domain MASE1